VYLQEVSFKNIKGFDDARLRFPKPTGAGNWHVILGDNGTGKTTILQAIALSLLAADDLLKHPEDWVRQGTLHGKCTAKFAGIGPQQFKAESAFTVAPEAKDGSLLLKDPGLLRFTPPVLSSGVYRTAGDPPLLVAGYGALRRLATGGTSSRKRRTLDDLVGSLFNPAYELTDLEDWLQRLDYIAKDGARQERDRNAAQESLALICRVVDSLLPQEPAFAFAGVDSRGAIFKGPRGEQLSLKDLSEGYRAIFGLAVDLMYTANLIAPLDSILALDANGTPYVNLAGIVLIDEVDTHLHPKWQQLIGPYLQRAFPKVQFIVTTHSPFVAQAATEGGLFVLEWTPRGVTVDQPPSSVQTLPAEEILESPVFGLETTRRPEIEQALQEYTRLKALAEAGTLQAAEKRRLQALTKKLKPALPPPGSAEETLKEIERRIREAGKQP
jgi:hypothetical protein